MSDIKYYGSSQWWQAFESSNHAKVFKQAEMHKQWTSYFKAKIKELQRKPKRCCWVLAMVFASQRELANVCHYMHNPARAY